MSRLRATALAAFLFFTPLTLFAQAEPRFTLPERPSARVNDYAGVLSSEARAGLEQRFKRFEDATGHQAAVAIFKSTGDWPIEDVATKLYDKWRLGSRERNDGVLLVLDIEDRAVRIETGYGLEDRLPDQLAGRIIQNDLVPFLRDGQYASAILVFENRLEEIFMEGREPRAVAQPRRGGNWSWLIWLIVFLFLVTMNNRRRRGRGRMIGRSGVIWTGGWIGGGGLGGWGGGGWGGGGGGWSGGGGLSGGGGASGRW